VILPEENENESKKILRGSLEEEKRVCSKV
jgi:hypothetical protein